MDNIQGPQAMPIRFFYGMAKKINTSLVARTSIFIAIAILIVTSAMLDVVSFGLHFTR